MKVQERKIIQKFVRKAKNTIPHLRDIYVEIQKSEKGRHQTKVTAKTLRGRMRFLSKDKDQLSSIKKAFENMHRYYRESKRKHLKRKKVSRYHHDLSLQDLA